MNKINSTNIILIIAALLISGSMIYFAETKPPEIIVAPPPPPPNPLEELFRNLRVAPPGNQIFPFEGALVRGECLGGNCEAGDNHQFISRRGEIGSNLYLMRESDGKEILIRKDFEDAVGRQEIFFEIKNGRRMELAGYKGNGCNFACFTVVDLDKMELGAEYSIYYNVEAELPKDMVVIKKGGKKFTVTVEEGSSELLSDFEGLILIEGLSLNGKIFKPLGITKKVSVNTMSYGGLPVKLFYWRYDLYVGDLSFNEIRYLGKSVRGKFFPSPVTFNDDFSKASFNPRLIFFDPRSNQEVLDLGEVTIDLR